METSRRPDPSSPQLLLDGSTLAPARRGKEPTTYQITGIGWVRVRDGVRVRVLAGDRVDGLYMVFSG